MRLFWLGCMFTVVIAGCSPWGRSERADQEDYLSSQQALTSLDCAQVAAHMDSEVTCIVVSPDALLLQTLDGTQSTLQVAGLSFTFDSTLYWSAVPGERMIIATIAGICVIGVDGMTRIVRPGQQIVIALDEEMARSPTIPAVLQPYDQDKIARASLDTLPRAVDLPAPVGSIDQPTPETAPATPPDSEAPTPISGECVVREDWGYYYTVRSGDNLTHIANRHGLTMAEMQEGNCLTNPNRIREGQILRVPSQSSSTSPITPTPGATFYADNTHLRPGSCTALHWEATEAGVVYFEGSPVAQHGTQEVCPLTTTTYTVRVYYMNGAQQDYTVTVVVEGNQ